MPAVLVTNFAETGEDVMVFTQKANAKHIESRIKKRKQHFDECYDVPENEVQYYVSDPCWVSLEEEEKLIQEWETSQSQITPS
jgi:hypothetical protein